MCAVHDLITTEKTPTDKDRLEFVSKRVILDVVGLHRATFNQALRPFEINRHRKYFAVLLGPYAHI